MKSFYPALMTCLCQVGGWLEGGMEDAMRNFSREGYRGVTDTWDVLQHEVRRGEGTSNISKLSKGEFNINSYV